MQTMPEKAREDQGAMALTRAGQIKYSQQFRCNFWHMNVLEFVLLEIQRGSHNPLGKSAAS